MARRIGHHHPRPRGNPDCRPVEGANGAATIARLYQDRREHDGTIRRVTRNVKSWQDAGVALRSAAAGMIEANKGFRRLKAHK